MFADAATSCVNKMTQVRSQPWGQLPSKVDLWTLQSSQVKVEVLTLGAIIRSVCSKGKDGQMDDVVLGYDDLEGKQSGCISETYSTVWLGLVHNSFKMCSSMEDKLDFMTYKTHLSAVARLRVRQAVLWSCGWPCGQQDCSRTFCSRGKNIPIRDQQWTSCSTWRPPWLQ